MEAIHDPRPIRDLRIAAGLTQEQLAEKVGIHRVSLATYESGRVTPSGRTLQQIAVALGVNASAIALEDKRRAS